MVKVAVVGVGAMGKNHVRVYLDMPEVQLVGIVDANQAEVELVGRKYKIPAYTDLCKMIAYERPDAVSIAVPTQAHFPVARLLLEAGCHVLIEKPISTTIGEARQLVEIAAQEGRVLMVGHIERFNPAIIELKRRLDAGDLGRVFQIYTRRLGPFPSRIQDVGVVLDLATHDLDIMRYLTGSEVARVYAEIKRELHTNHEDLFVGVLRFTDSIVGLLEINWLTPTKIRELYVTGERGMFRVNYISQDLYLYENADTNGSDWSALNLMRGVSEGVMIQYPIHKKEPLRAELETFISNINGAVQNGVSGKDAQEALALAISLVESARICQVQEVGRDGLYRNQSEEQIKGFSASAPAMVPCR